MSDDSAARFEALWTTHCAPRLGLAREADATMRGDVVRDGAQVTADLPLLSLNLSDGEAPAAEGAGDHELYLGALLGEGGMGQVFAGVQRSLGRAVAVKVLSAGGDASRRAALLHEARVTGRLEHPNIVPVHALGADASGRPVMVMKRIEGASWRAVIRDPSLGAWTRRVSQHRDALEAHVEVLLRVCDALSYAHAQGVIHRDVKPENVLLGAFGEVVLLDWGVALDSRAPMPPPSVVGTPAYMAPEMLDGDPAKVTPATDVYLLGATLHEALTGRPPHAGQSLRDVLFAAWTSAPPTFAAAVPRELAALCAAALSRAPEDRPGDVAAFRAALEGWKRHRASIALSDAAREGLAEIVAAESARAAGEVPLSSPGAWDRALASRFGFARALAQWPGNVDAREGITEVLGRMADRAAALGDVDGARALLAEMPGRDADRASALEALASARDEVRAREEAARAVQREMDLSAWTREHPWVFAVLALSIAALAVWVWRRRDLAPGSPYATLLPADLVSASLAAAALIAVRRRALRNLIGRRLTAVVALTVAATMSVDVLCAAQGYPVSLGSAHRLLTLGAVCFSAAILGLPSLALPGALSVLAAALAVALPTRSYELMPLALLTITASVGWLAWSGRLRASAADALREDLGPPRR